MPRSPSGITSTASPAGSAAAHAARAGSAPRPAPGSSASSCPAPGRASRPMRHPCRAYQRAPAGGRSGGRSPAAPRRAAPARVRGAAAGRPDRRCSAGTRNSDAADQRRDRVARQARAPASRPAGPRSAACPAAWRSSRSRARSPPGPSALCTRSWSPTLAPPVVTSRSQPRAAAAAVGDGLAVVGRDRQHHRLAAGGAHQRGQRMGVAELTMPPGGIGLAGQGDLVAGRQDADARPPMHREPGMVGGGGQADVARGQRAAGGQQRLARRRSPGRGGGSSGRRAPPRSRGPGRRRRLGVLLQQDAHRRPRARRRR